MNRAPLLILVVEDEPALRALVSSVLREEGYIVIEARNGQEALDLLAQADANLVVLDLSMPIMNGWEFVRKARVEYPRLPILVMTAQYRAHAEIKELGAVGFLSKPFDLSALLDTVASLVKPA